MLNPVSLDTFFTSLMSSMIGLLKNSTAFHDANCSGVKAKFLPLTGGFTYGDLTKDEYRKLTPCVYCGAPQRPETLYERWVFEAAQIGMEPTEEIRKAFGLEP